MTIYVDELVDYGWKYGRSCHMSTDDQSEAGWNQLHQLAQRIGLKRSWFQIHQIVSHYDLTASMRSKAIKAGAVPVKCTEFVRICENVSQKGKDSDSAKEVSD